MSAEVSVRTVVVGVGGVLGVAVDVLDELAEALAARTLARSGGELDWFTSVL